MPGAPITQVPGGYQTGGTDGKCTRSRKSRWAAVLQGAELKVVVHVCPVLHSLLSLGPAPSVPSSVALDWPPRSLLCPSLLHTAVSGMLKRKISGGPTCSQPLSLGHAGSFLQNPGPGPRLRGTCPPVPFPTRGPCCPPRPPSPYRSPFWQIRAETQKCRSNLVLIEHPEYMVNKGNDLSSWALHSMKRSR